MFYQIDKSNQSTFMIIFNFISKMRDSVLELKAKSATGIHGILERKSFPIVVLLKTEVRG